MAYKHMLSIEEQKCILETLGMEIRDGLVNIDYSNKVSKMSIANKNRPLLECYKCKRKMTASNLKRWHGDNCRGI